MKLCDDCTRGPANSDGHDKLLVRTMGDSGMSFQCSVCEAYWTRATAPGGFVWTDITDRIAQSRGMVGAAVPPRTR